MFRVEPPPALPEWNAGSPYVWLRKEFLPKLRVRPLSAFGDDGELGGDVATVLAATDNQQRALSSTLPRLLAEYHALEAAKAERVEEHLPGIGDDGSKVTVRFNPLPEEGAWFKEQFDAALRNELGEQRANLLTQLAEGWFNDQFNRFGTEPKTISVSRHPNGTYGFAVKTGDGLGSSDGLLRIDNYLIPPHLRPLFSDVLSPTDSADPTGAPETR